MSLLELESLLSLRCLILSVRLQHSELVLTSLPCLRKADVLMLRGMNWQFRGSYRQPFERGGPFDCFHCMAILISLLGLDLEVRAGSCWLGFQMLCRRLIGQGGRKAANSAK